MAELGLLANNHKVRTGNVTIWETSSSLTHSAVVNAEMVVTGVKGGGADSSCAQLYLAALTLP